MIAKEDSVSEALQQLAAVGKRRCNPRITGFVKVVDNTTVDGVLLPDLLEEWLYSMAS
jgi:hypothetical protein